MALITQNVKANVGGKLKFPVVTALRSYIIILINHSSHYYFLA